MDDVIRAKRPAMVVAHPDDEAMWGAGMLLRYPKNWDVICLTTPERDPERAELFFKSCQILGANPVLVRQVETVHRIDFKKIDLEPYDLIVTHNRHGEYGHPQHKEVHTYVIDNYPEKSIFFGYRPKCSVRDFEIALTPDECKKKMAAIQCYDNIGSANRPTWVLLMDAFSHKFDLWCEPYER